MAISSLTIQPGLNQLMAAYRPIVYRVVATRTDGQPVPPVVYCDIYFDGAYYKSLSATQYEKKNVSNSEFEFDISDAAQEFLKYQLPENGGSLFITASNVFRQCYCRFRSSGFDADGFLTVEDTPPVQGTGSLEPVGGTGFLSNSSFLVNASLQHEDNQDLNAHLQSFKANTNGGWDDDAMPLTHRPKVYKICHGDSDYYPFVDLQDREYKCIRLVYKEKGQSSFTTLQYCVPQECQAVQFVGTITLPNAYVGILYVYSFELTGTAPYTFVNEGLPFWMTAVINGSTVALIGMPTKDDVGSILVGFSIENCGGNDNYVSVEQTITVSDECVPAVIENVSPTHAIIDHPYSFTIHITAGTGPFYIDSIVAPAWMTIVIAGSEIHLSGAPDELAEDQQVAFDIRNCTTAVAPYNRTIDVIPNELLIAWDYTETGAEGVMNIYRDGVQVLHQTMTGSGTIVAAPDEVIKVEIFGGTGLNSLYVGNDTGTLYSSTDDTIDHEYEFTASTGPYNVSGNVYL